MWMLVHPFELTRSKLRGREVNGCKRGGAVSVAGLFSSSSGLFGVEHLPSVTRSTNHRSGTSHSHNYSTITLHHLLDIGI